MKRKLSVILLIVFVATFAFTAVACSSDEPEPQEPQKHVCGHVCPICSKCTDSACTDKVCENKCQGHEPCPDVCDNCGKCKNAFCTAPSHAEKCTCPTTADGKFLITDEEGNYGGTYLAAFGNGSPLNGKYDVENDVYYTKNDYFNMKCTETRTIIPRFASYQQTTGYGDGVACAMMILNYFGEDVVLENNELALMEKYEALNGTSIAKKASTVDGMVNLFDDLGYTAYANPFIASSTSNAPGAVEFSDWVIGEIKTGNIIMIRYQDGIDFRWHVVVGMDTMGDNLEYLVRDNVLILADPCDDSDHYQDGYSITSVSRFYSWWNKQGKSSTSQKHECIEIVGKKAFNLVTDTNDVVNKGQNLAPERHLLLNADGSFGGTLQKQLYGTIEEKNGYVDPEIAGFIYEGAGSIEHTTYNYFAYPDYYNMKPSSSRLILENYQAFEQTEASSCGICSVFSVLNYYKYDFSNIHNHKDILKRAQLFANGKKPTTSGGTAYSYWNSTQTATFGPVDANDNGRKQEALTLIYMAHDSAFDSGTKLFNNYGGVGASKLKNVPNNLGYTATSTSSSTYHGVFPTYSDFVTWVKGNLSKKQPMCTGWCPVSGHWTTIIGYDDMGTSFTYDDVIIIADSHDVSDHYQDGYNTYPATMFWAQWRNGGGGTFEQYVVVKNPNA